MKHGKEPSVKVVAGDPNQYVGSGRVDGHVSRNRVGHRPGAFGVDEDRRQLVPGGEGALDHEIAFGHEDSGHVTVRLLAPLPQHVVAQALKNLNARVVRIIDRRPAVDHAMTSGAVARNVRTDVVGEQCEDFAVVGVASGLTLRVDPFGCPAVGDLDIEHAAATGDEHEIIDDVLIVRKQILRRAHGVT